jgi:hypothetical protein
MENKIPIPTDNIFKFYALFGLLLFIFSASSIIYVTRSANELVFQSVVEVEAIKQIQNPSPVDKAKLQILEKRLEISASDKIFYIKGIGAITGISVVLMIWGFTKWHRDVQPIQDEMAQLQLEKLRHEVKQLKHHNSSADKSPPSIVAKK